MKNFKKYNKEIYDKVIYDFQHSFLSKDKLSEHYNVSPANIQYWISGKKRVFNKVDRKQVYIIEKVIGTNFDIEIIDASLKDINKSMDRYFGKNENNFAGLKSKV